MELFGGFEVDRKERGGVKPGKNRNFQKWQNDDDNNNKLPKWFIEA